MSVGIPIKRQTNIELPHSVGLIITKTQTLRTLTFLTLFSLHFPLLL